LLAERTSSPISSTFKLLHSSIKRFAKRSSYSLSSIGGSYEKVVYGNDASKLCGRSVNRQSQADHHFLLSNNQKQAGRFTRQLLVDGRRDSLSDRGQALRSMIFSDKLLNLSAVRETSSVYRYDSDPLTRGSRRSVKKSTIQANSRGCRMAVSLPEFRSGCRHEQSGSRISCSTPEPWHSGANSQPQQSRIPFRLDRSIPFP